MAPPVNTHIAAAANDAPIVDPKEDRLQRAGFAKQVAASILSVDATSGFVFGLNGTWGSGKTSVINMIRHHLASAVAEKRIVITEFRPWWFSGQEQLIQQYFRHLWSVFKKPDVPGAMAKLGDAFECMGNIFDKLSSAPNVPGSYGWAGRAMQAVAFAFSSDARARQMSLDEWRGKAIAQLAGQKARLLIVIDDIDRLAPDEIAQMLQVVKAVGNFPNTIYLLSFDVLVVEQALERVQAGSGREYLEKIVQIPIDLPRPDSSALHRLFFAQLDPILEGTPEQIWKPSDWTFLFWDVISHYLESIRDVNRTLNRLRATYPLIRGEVNGPEFVALQVLYLFEPLLVEYVQSNKKVFVDEVSEMDGRHGQRQGDRADAEKFLDTLRLANREAARAALRRFFPNWAARADRTGGYTHHWLSNWRREKRMRHPEVFGLFFTLQVPPGDITAAEMAQILDTTRDPAAFAAELLRLVKERRPDGTTRARDFLDRLQDYTENGIPVENFAPVLAALFNVGDALSVEADAIGMFSTDNAMMVLRVIHQLTKRLQTQQERHQILREAMIQGAATYTIVHKAAVLGQEHGKFGAKDNLSQEPMRTVSAEQLADLEAIAVDKIRTAAKDGRLLATPRLISILHSWKEWAGVDEPRAFVSGVVVKDERFVAVAEGVSGRSRSVSEAGVREWTSVDVETLVEFIGQAPDALAKRAEMLLSTISVSLTPKQRDVLQTLIDNVRNPKNKWGDPIREGHT